MSNRDIFAELVEGFESLAAEREGEKKHFGWCTIATKTEVYTQKDI